MLWFYDLSKVQAINFHTNSKNFRNEAVPPSYKEEKGVVQLSWFVFLACITSVNLAHMHKSNHSTADRA